MSRARERALSPTMHRSRKWYNLSGRIVCQHVSKFLKRILFDSAIPLLGKRSTASLKQMHRDICTKMFTAALLQWKTRINSLSDNKGMMSCILVEPMECHEFSKENGESQVYSYMSRCACLPRSCVSCPVSGIPPSSSSFSAARKHS